MNELSEKEIIIRIQKGKINYFEILVNRYSKIVYFYTKRKIIDEEDAKDIVQNSFVKAYKAIDRFNTEKNFYPFLFSIVKNEIAEFYRRKNNNWKLNEQITTDEVDLEYEKLDIGFLFDSIKSEHRLVLEMYYIKGLSYKEIAEELGKPINTIKTLLRRAKIEAKEIYEKE